MQDLFERLADILAISAAPSSSQLPGEESSAPANTAAAAVPGGQSATNAPDAVDTLNLLSGWRKRALHAPKVPPLVSKEPCRDKRSISSLEVR